MMSKVKPELLPVERELLVEAGLILLERRGRATHIVPTDRAWDWAVENFDTEIYRSSSAAIVLQALLSKIGRYSKSHGVALADLLHSQPAETPDPEKNLENQIQAAYTNVHSASGVGVRLSSLRRHLNTFTRQELDETLRTMYLAEKLDLVPIDDPQAIKPEDQEAAIDIGGSKRHIVDMG